MPTTTPVPVQDDVSDMLVNRVNDRTGVAAAMPRRRPLVSARAIDVPWMANPATISARESGRP